MSLKKKKGNRLNRRYGAIVSAAKSLLPGARGRAGSSVGGARHYFIGVSTLMMALMQRSHGARSQDVALVPGCGT